MEHVVGLILALTGLALFVAVAIYVLLKLREARNSGDAPSTQEMLNNFGELYDSGELTREEFRAVKRTLAAALTAELEKKKTEKADGKNAKELDREQRLKRLLQD